MYERKSKQTLSEKLFVSVRDKILSGEYKSGENLTEIRLSGEYNISRTPIREVLRKLEAEGLVCIQPNCGAVVTTLSENEVSDVFNIRLRLESMAAYLAAQNITKAQLEKLEKSITGGENSDFDFHEIIYEATESKPLIKVLKSMNCYVSLVKHENLKREQRANEVINEHKAIFEAIKNGDSSLAEKLTYEHILNAAKTSSTCVFVPLNGENLH